MTIEATATSPAPEPATSDIHLERRGAVLWVTLDRPDRLNAISPRMTQELYETFDGLARDTSVRVVVLRGRGRGFCAGLDINTAETLSERDVELPTLPDVVRAMRTCPQPIIALVQGPACGGGFAFALAADVRIAATDAKLNVAFVRLGVSGCEMGTSYFLPRIVGLTVASELLLTGRFIHADRALRTGLVSEVVEADALEATGEELARDMLRVAPTALRKTKEVLTRAIEVDHLGAVLEMEMAAQQTCMHGGDFEEGIAAFREGREPTFGGSAGGFVNS